MRSCKWGLSMLLIMSFLAFSSSSWADKKPKHQRDQQGWDDQWDKRDGDHPPGWDKGKKTGWRGNDLPPGQEKKYRQRYEDNYRYGYPRPVPVPVPEPIPVPVPVPVPR